MNRPVNIRVVSRETLIQTREIYQRNKRTLYLYLDRLIWWNSKINLVSRDVSRETIREHIIHSLIPHTLGLLQHSDVWVDAGTGGGLPGIPLSIVISEKSWIMNDIVNKKIAALNQMIHFLKLGNARTATGSISTITLPESCGIITKHAFKTDQLLQAINGKDWGTLILYKGVEMALSEIERVKDEYDCSLYKFDFTDDEPFYEGKGIVVIERSSSRTA